MDKFRKFQKEEGEVWEYNPRHIIAILPRFDGDGVVVVTDDGESEQFVKEVLDDQ